MSRKAEDLFTAAGIVVDGPTVLMPFKEFGGTVQIFLFAVINQSPNPVAITVETSENGVNPKTVVVDTCESGKQWDVEVGPDQIRRYWRLSAQADSPSNVDVIVRGIRRTPSGGH